MNIDLGGNEQQQTPPPQQQQQRQRPGVQPQQAPRQPQGQQNGYPPVAQNNRNKILLTVLLAFVLVVLIALVVLGMKDKIRGGNQADVIETTTVIPAATSPDGTVPSTNVDLSTASQEELIAEIQRLQQEVTTLSSQPTAPSEIPGAPPGVTSVSEWQSQDPNVIAASETRMYTEFVPYTKKYVPLGNGGYMFALVVNYGGQDYILTVSYQDYTLLKDKGVIAVNIEVAAVPNGETTRDVVTCILVNPEWQLLLPEN